MLLGGVAGGDGRSVFVFEGFGAGVNGVEFGAGFEEADAAVPAEDAVVIASRTGFFGFGEAAKGFFDEREKDVGGATRMQLSFGAAFVEKAGVIVAFVGIAERGEDGLDFGVAVGGGAGELVGDGEAEYAAGELMIGVDGENIAADGFGFLGFVEVAVELGFGDGFGDAGFGDGF